MPVYKMTLNIERDGQQMPNFPKVKRLSVDEDQQFSYSKSDDNDTTTFTSLPIDQFAEVQVLVAEPDAQMVFRIDGQTDAGIVVNAGGLLLLWDVDADASATTNATVNNNAGDAAADIKGFAGGT